ncbi:hypothetical protein FLONG3_4080 [Fusarium longipes]|uniref:Zn(2)-C6 fungal-type domain-containing protein n=1 Tax=Fusarium longipes TaxID=694270 RepID=A0A395SZY5_9HYPO|nr:hypothetical protein FLONG3_4080 [Fusarium longipes]
MTRQASADQPQDQERRSGKRPAPRGTAFYPRKRANTACQVCRSRKTKCDNLKPSCSYCLSVGATCIQSPIDLSSFDPASLKILERLDELEKILRDTRNDVSHQVPAVNVGQTDAHTQELTPVEESAVEEVRSLPMNDIPLRSILPEKMESLLLWSVLSRDMSAHATLQNDAPQPSPSYSPGSTSLADIADLDTQGVKVLLDRFFAHVHCKNPILDEAAARRLVLNVMMEGIDWSPGSCLTLLICALGKIATPLDATYHLKADSTQYQEAQALFQTAQKRIGTLMARSDIISAQCFFLSGVFLMSTFRPFEAWRYFSQALATCQTLPFLQRAQFLSVSDGPELPIPELSETQQEAVYWSSWKSERELRGELSLPDFSIPYSSSVLYPPFFPTPPHPLESTKTVASSRQHTAWLFYLSEISLRRLSHQTCNDILELHRSSTSNLSFLKQLALLIPAYEAQANEWADSLPSELSITSGSIEDNVCCFVLRGHLVNFFERLYWPFVMAHFAAVEGGITTPIPGIQFVKKGLEYHLLNVDVNEAGFLHRHHGTWFMIRALVRSATVLLAARRLGCEVPSGWRVSCERIIQVLRAWEDDVQGLPNHRNFLEEVLYVLDG